MACSLCLIKPVRILLIYCAPIIGQQDLVSSYAIIEKEHGKARIMGVMTYTIARGLFTIEQRAPRMRKLTAGTARFLGRAVAEYLEGFRLHSLLCSAAWTGPRAGKKNCWEYSDCCKQVHGSLSGALGVCPAALESRLDGIHGGRNGGRACWVVPGTHCRGQVQDTPEQKRETCRQCGFYAAVRFEEGILFIHRNEMLRALLQ